MRNVVRIICTDILHSNLIFIRHKLQARYQCICNNGIYGIICDICDNVISKYLIETFDFCMDIFIDILLNRKLLMQIFNSNLVCL